VENQIFTEKPTHPYNIKYLQTGLFPTGTPTPKPWSTIPQELRDQVDGIMVLKMRFTAADVDLFPKLKV
jgi:C-terminal binding protein